MLSGSFEFPPSPLLKGTTVLEKPVGEAQLLAHLSPLVTRKATRSGLCSSFEHQLLISRLTEAC